MIAYNTIHIQYNYQYAIYAELNHYIQVYTYTNVYCVIK